MSGNDCYCLKCNTHHHPMMDCCGFLDTNPVEKLQRENTDLKMRVEELEVSLQLAIDYIKKSPCDPVINQEQLEAYSRLTSNALAEELLK